MGISPENSATIFNFSFFPLWKWRNICFYCFRLKSNRIYILLILVALVSLVIYDVYFSDFFWVMMTFPLFFLAAPLLVPTMHLAVQHCHLTLWGLTLFSTVPERKTIRTILHDQNTTGTCTLKTNSSYSGMSFHEIRHTSSNTIKEISPSNSSFTQNYRKGGEGGVEQKEA